MIVTSLARALTHAILDAAIADESARRAAKGAVDAGLAPAAAALGDIPGAVQAGAGAVTKVAGAVGMVDGEEATALDFVENEAGRLASGNFVAALVESSVEKAVGATAGGVAEAATEGEFSVLDGLTASRGLARGLLGSASLDEGLAQCGTRAGAGLALGGVAVTLADPDERADAFRYGAGLGLRLDALRVEGDVAARALGLAEVGAEWGVAGAVRAEASERSWTEALAFGRGVAASVAGGARALASFEASPFAGVSAAQPLRDASTESRARESTAAGVLALAGGAGGLAAQVAAFAAQQEADSGARRAAASGDEHAARAAQSRRVEAAGLHRFHSAADALGRAADALREAPRAQTLGVVTQT